MYLEKLTRVVAARGTLLLVKADYETARTDARAVVNALK